MAEITHVIFDLDGLLIDTETLYTECTQSILDRYNKTYTREAKINAMGRPKLESAQIVVDSVGIPLTAKEFSKQLYDQLFKRFPDAKYMPGALEMVQHLHAHGIPLALATGSDTPAYESKLSRKPELLKCFSHTICSDNPLVKNGKPSPDIYLVAANKFIAPPVSMNKVLVFEDAPNGVQGAKAAGMNVVMVPDENIDVSLTKGADRVLKSLCDVDLTEWNLPRLLSK